MIAHLPEQSSKRVTISGKKSQRASDGITQKRRASHREIDFPTPISTRQSSLTRKLATSSVFGMIDSSEKNPLRYTSGMMRMLWQPLLFALVLAVIAVSGLQLFGKYQYVRELRNVAESQYNATLERQAGLTHTLDMLETRSGQERVLREHFNVVKEGEEIVVLVPDKQQVSQ